MKVFYRFFLYWASDKPQCKFGDNPCKALQRSGRKPLFPGVQADRWLAVFVRYKRLCSPFQSSISHCCSNAPVISSCPLVLTPACLPYPCSQFLPSATEDSFLPPLFGYSWLLSSRPLSAHQEPWFPSSQHGSHCWPALPCRGLAPEHGLPHVMVQESATGQKPSSLGYLRQIVTCLISGPTAPFILVFSAGHNHVVDSPAYLHTLIIGSNRQRSLTVLWGQKHHIMFMRLHKPEYLPSLTSHLRRADRRQPGEQQKQRQKKMLPYTNKKHDKRRRKWRTSPCEAKNCWIILIIIQVNSMKIVAVEQNLSLETPSKFVQGLPFAAPVATVELRNAMRLQFKNLRFYIHLANGWAESTHRLFITDCLAEMLLIALQELDVMSKSLCHFWILLWQQEGHSFMCWQMSASPCFPGVWLYCGLRA